MFTPLICYLFSQIRSSFCNPWWIIAEVYWVSIAQRIGWAFRWIGDWEVFREFVINPQRTRCQKSWVSSDVLRTVNYKWSSPSRNVIFSFLGSFSHSNSSAAAFRFTEENRLLQKLAWPCWAILLLLFLSLGSYVF